MYIKVTSGDIDHICSQIKRAKSQGDGAIGKVSRARNVEHDISSRMNISHDLSYLSREVGYEISRLDMLLRAIRQAENDFEDADKDVRSKSKTMATKIRKAQREALWETISASLFNALQEFKRKYSAMLAALSRTSATQANGPIIGGASLILLANLTAAMEAKKEEKQVSATAHQPTEDSENATDTTDTAESQKDRNQIMNGDNVIHFTPHSNPNGACVMWALTGLVRRMQALNGQESLIDAKTIYTANGETNAMQSWRKSSNLTNVVKNETGFSLGYLRNGGGRTVEALNNHLEQHEAGLVCYFGGKDGGPSMSPHAVLITRVENGRYYCIDYDSKKAASSNAQEVLLEESSLVKRLHYPADYNSLLGYMNEIVYIN